MSNKGPIHKGTFSGRRMAYNADYVYRDEDTRRRRAETCGFCGGRGWHTAGGEVNTCSCPAGEVKPKESPRG